MKVLIVEDEVPAVAHISALLSQIDHSVEILDALDSVKSAVRWFESNSQPDLAFFDIQLADGKSFEIFERVKVSCPIVFITAYDQFAIKAFEVNSIDYLLKPITKEKLERAINKFKAQNKPEGIDMEALKSLIGGQDKKYKEQFIIKVGEHLKKVAITDVELFTSQDRSTYLLTKSGNKLILDNTLDQLQDMVDPDQFFRVNRKYLIHMDGIKDMISFSGSRLKIEMSQFDGDDVVVSREKVGEFKAWLDR